MVVHVSPVLSKLGEFPPTVFASTFQILLCSPFLPMSGFLDMPSVQSFLIEFFTTHITSGKKYEDHLRWMHLSWEYGQFYNNIFPKV